MFLFGAKCKQKYFLQSLYQEEEFIYSILVSSFKIMMGWRERWTNRCHPYESGRGEDKAVLIVEALDLLIGLNGKSELLPRDIFLGQNKEILDESLKWSSSVGWLVSAMDIWCGALSSREES